MSKRPPLRFIRKISKEPMPQADWLAAERLLAELIARAYWADLQAELGSGASAAEGDRPQSEVEEDAQIM